ncbi:hypothetical protein N182_35730 [Sinorhizobium sp. GL2]|nr:hypothetical protein N182_35730 [Sinorhizobium sp. GL2]
MAAELNGTVKITYDPKAVACEVDANLLSESAVKKLIELEAWGALPAMSVDWVRDHIVPERTFSFSLTAGVIATGQVASESFRSFQKPHGAGTCVLIPCVSRCL